MAACEALTYNTPVRVRADAPVECRPGEWAVVISANPTPESVESYTVEFEDGFDGEVPAEYVAAEDPAARPRAVHEVPQLWHVEPRR